MSPLSPLGLHSTADPFGRVTSILDSDFGRRVDSFLWPSNEVKDFGMLFEQRGCDKLYNGFESSTHTSPNLAKESAARIRRWASLPDKIPESSNIQRRQASTTSQRCPALRMFELPSLQDAVSIALDQHMNGTLSSEGYEKIKQQWWSANRPIVNLYDPWRRTLKRSRNQYDSDADDQRPLRRQRTNHLLTSAHPGSHSTAAAAQSTPLSTSTASHPAPWFSKCAPFPQPAERARYPFVPFSQHTPRDHGGEEPLSDDEPSDAESSLPAQPPSPGDDEFSDHTRSPSSDSEGELSDEEPSPPAQPPRRGGNKLPYFSQPSSSNLRVRSHSQHCGSQQPLSDEDASSESRSRLARSSSETPSNARSDTTLEAPSGSSSSPYSLSPQPKRAPQRKAQSKAAKSNVTKSKATKPKMVKAAGNGEKPKRGGSWSREEYEVLYKTLRSFQEAEHAAGLDKNQRLKDTRLWKEMAKRIACDPDRPVYRSHSGCKNFFLRYGRTIDHWDEKQGKYNPNVKCTSVQKSKSKGVSTKQNEESSKQTGESSKQTKAVQKQQEEEYVGDENDEDENDGDDNDEYENDGYEDEEDGDYE